MQLQEVTLSRPRGNGPSTWPAEVKLVLSSLEAASGGWDERREPARASYNVLATLRLFVDPPENPEKLLYARDVNTRSMGFISAHRLPLGYGGIARVPAPDGGSLEVPCSVLRCRSVSPGWYEGGLFFAREQMEFSDVIDDRSR